MSVCICGFQYLKGRKIYTKNFYNFYFIINTTNHSSLFYFHIFHLLLFQENINKRFIVLNSLLFSELLQRNHRWNNNNLT